MQTQQYVRKPFFVDAVRVTSANMDEVAAWCKGDVQLTEKFGEKPIEKFIQVDVHMPMNDRQTRAFVGDWVLQHANGFKVYTPRGFEKSFDKVEEESVAHRDAGSGKFVTEEFAEKNPDTTVTERN